MNGFPSFSRSRCYSSLPTLLLTGLLLLDAPLAQAQVGTLGFCEIESSNGVLVREQALDGALPLDVSHLVWDDPPGHDLASGPHGAWCYADQTGRVRGRVFTGADNESPVNADVYLQWAQWFVRTPGTRDPDFTVTPSHLLLEAYPNVDPGVTQEQAPLAFANMRFRVYVVSEFSHFVVFEHRSRMHGLPGDDTFRFEENTTGDAARIAADGSSTHPATSGIDVDERNRLATFEVPAYNQQIPLDRYGVAFGDEYRIVYELDASAGESVMLESRAEALIGDPLNADSGFLLSTVHEPVAQPPAQCDAVPDPGRYEDSGDGTITDSRTGLMWQRCPAGFELNDAGTAGDTTDDACVADPGAAQQFDWQGALQEAAAASLGGHEDWRAPNAKDLATLVEPCSRLAQTNPLAFPGTPGSAFWTATPEENATASPRRSWVVNFGSGELAAAPRKSSAYLRAVRDTGAMPVPAGVSVSAGNASVLEGDSGTTTLFLPVGLSAPLGNDVSVDYVVGGLDAADGADFLAASGTLLIAAGETLAHVEVTVMGDTDVERNELIVFELSNQAGASWLRKANGSGTIIDDEPMFELAPSVQVSETNANELQNIPVKLDRPAVETISIDYSTLNGTAVAGDDYLAANGTLTFQPGDTETNLPLTIVGDTVPESVEQLQIEFENAVGAALLVSPSVMTIDIADDDGVAAYGALNDTGVSTCANGSQAMLDCPQAGYPGQDAEHGRDVTDADPSDGALGFSFVKRDSSGDALANQAGLYSQEPWDCVEDQVTGLFWEVKSDVQADLRFSDHTFTWYNTSGSNDGGDAGTANGGACPDGVSCDTEKYVAAVNAAGLCGFDDWRLPSADELFNIAWLSAESFSGIDTAYFPNHFAPPDGRGYWSSTPSVFDPQSAMRVRLEAGVNAAATVGTSAKDSTHRIRLVRGSAQSAQ